MLGEMKILIPLIFLIGLTTVGAKTLEDVLAKARAYVAPEEKLESIEVLFYDGTLTPANGSPARKVSLLLQKPASQRLEITQGNGRITMVVNEKEGFMVRENLETGDKQTTSLPLEQVRLFKANASENLNFFQFPPRSQVRTKYLGEQEFRGQTVDVVRYIHPHGIVFLRYFDPETGRLVATESDGGTINIEEGSMEVGGIRFSDKILAYESDELVHTIQFERSDVNPDLPEWVFDFPE